MASSVGKVGYSSFSSLEKENNKRTYIDDFDDVSWTAEPVGHISETLHNKISYPVPLDAEDVLDECDSGDEQYTHVAHSAPPEVNLKNVFSGMFAILTGHTKDYSGKNGIPQLPSSNVSFLGSASNGETFLHSSVYILSSPPLLEKSAFDYSAYKEVLKAEPPEWLPDSCTAVCMQRNAPFTALTRGRHHCRFCGGIFCRLNLEKGTHREYVIPAMIGVFINTISNAVQTAKHDFMDWTCSRGWLNLPLGVSMEHEI